MAGRREGEGEGGGGERERERERGREREIERRKRPSKRNPHKSKYLSFVNHRNPKTCGYLPTHMASEEPPAR